jgi:predicted naringenin-chalcone synthase
MRESKRLSLAVAQAAIHQCPMFQPTDITHVITVSCTGFYNPGPDYDVVLGLALPARVERYHLGFMGCYAALPALRMAQQFCQANPDAVVLIVCLELCTLHLQVKGDVDSLLGNALFADGAAAVVVSARAPDRPTLALGDFQSALALEGKGEMAWEIGDRGFNLVLSSYVPDIIASNLLPILESTRSIDRWAVHPGGKAILDRVERGLELAPDELAASRSVLRDYGNMSSVTILFVLERLLSELVPGQRLCALAFGPGLTLQTAVFEAVAATQSAPLPSRRWQKAEELSKCVPQRLVGSRGRGERPPTKTEP